jgi:tetratricopeptide (TPR) repeat protein
LRRLPNSAEVYLAIGAIERRQGKWAESTANLEKAASLSPKDAWILKNLSDNYRANKNFETADKTLDRAIEAAPQSFGGHAVKGELAIEWRGDFSVMEKELAGVPPGADPEGYVTVSRWYLLTMQRKFPEALAVVKQITELHEKTATEPRAFYEGIVYSYLNDKKKARSAFEEARLIAERSLRESPDSATRHVLLGQILAGLGQKEAAIAEGKRAVELLPEAEDALSGPKITLGLAIIYARTGEVDQALQLLDHLLTVPAGVTVPLLKLDPVWDPLRADPRFQTLINKAVEAQAALDAVHKNEVPADEVSTL